MNANDITSKFYDSVTLILRPEELTLEELSLVKSLTKPGDSILDVGAGTGRHAIPLAKLSYEITALEDSMEMIKAMINEKRKMKNEKLEVINSNIFNYNLRPITYNLIILMWNTFNEICLTEENAIKLLQKLKKSLVDDGEILININDSQFEDPSKFDFKYEFSLNNKDYTYTGKTIAYEANTNTSTLQEIIMNDKEAYVTNIIQRYWSLEEITNLALKVGLTLTLKKLKTSNELYIVLKEFEGMNVLR